MPNEIEFPDIDPGYVFDRDCLAFRALADAKAVDCLVTAELLLARFGARDMTEEAMRQAYREHRDEIQNIARNHIENGWIEEGRLFLTTRFTRLSVTFGEDLARWPTLRAVVNTAHRMLTAILGPNAEVVTVEWDASEDDPAPDKPSIRVRIADPSIPHAVKAFFVNKDWEHPTEFGMILAGMWNSILRARSRKLILEAG